MKKKSHQGLTALVARFGTIKINPRLTNELLEASIEPDEENKRMIFENLLENINVPFEWLLDHTVRAKELAIECIIGARNARLNGDPVWIKLMGWAYHYIADWGVPHHSPTSESNPVIDSIANLSKLGLQISEQLKGDAEPKEFLKALIKGALWGAAIGAAIGITKLAINHNDFEKECDKHWNAESKNIEVLFNEFRKKVEHPRDINIALDVSDVMMDKLRQTCNNLPAEWIWNCNRSEYSEYMATIAIIIDYACQIINYT